MTNLESFTIGENGDGLRLDKALHAAMPGAGLRLRRRLCDDGRVLVGGKERKPGYKVRAGQTVEILEGEEYMTPAMMGLKIVAHNGGFAAVSKPGGVHSAAIAGKDGPCVENVLSELFPDTEPVLLNRLDFLTSGLLLVALDADAEARYHELESSGQIKKFYLAEVRGRLDGMVTVKSALDMDNRKTTKVLEDDDPDARRWTDVTVLSHDNEAETTLVRCLIMKGARHQIRAHLASIGHPVVGDPIYGEGGDGLRLHHHQTILPGFGAESTPPF